MGQGKKPRNVYIVGAQSTGKTTLVKAIQEIFLQDTKIGRINVPKGHLTSRPAIITEVARIVLQRHGFTALDITSSPTRALALQQLILLAQQNAELAALQKAEWFISDRSGVDPLAYTLKYVGETAVNDLLKLEAWIEVRERMEMGVVIVCEAGMDWLTDDGVRLMPGSREEWIGFHRVFCGFLDRLGLVYEVLPCEVTEHQERVEFVLSRLR